MGSVTCAIQIVLPTPYYLKAVSLGQLLAWGEQTECRFQGQRSRWGASDCLGPARRSTRENALSVTSSKTT